jgi:L-ascorbate oxidase
MIVKFTGMQTAWVFGDASDIFEVYPPRDHVMGYLEYKGAAYGNATYNPTVLHFFDTGDMTTTSDK